MAPNFNAAASALTEYWPQDTPTEFYIYANGMDIRVGDILDAAAEHWPDVKLTLMDITIEPKYEHLYAVGYDQYDPSDYAMFLKISRSAPNEVPVTTALVPSTPEKIDGFKVIRAAK